MSMSSTYPEPTKALCADLQSEIPDVRFDHMTRALYSTDASIYQMMPIGVACPLDADEVAAIVSICAKHRTPVLPRGGGTSLAGQAIGHALIVDFSRYMDSILEIDLEARRVRTQPGLTLGLLNRDLKQHGLMFGPDPASADRATMGGVLGNNSTGAHSIVYGMSADHVHSTRVVLADGSLTDFHPIHSEIWSQLAKQTTLEGEIYNSVGKILERYAEQIATRYPRTFRHVAGYNLNQLTGLDYPNLSKLIVGSEGTLGVMTEMELNLVPVPESKRLAMVHFADMHAAMEAVPALLETGATAIEVLDKMLLDLTRDKPEYRRLLTFVEGDPAVILVIEYAGDSQAACSRGVQKLEAVLSRMHHKEPVIHITDPAEQANVWYVRKVGLGILMSIRGDAKPIPFIEDAAVPVEHLADYVSEIYSFAQQVGISRVAIYAHASAGCLHIRPLVNLKEGRGIQQMRQIAEHSVELVLKYGGTTSGEHGEGIARAEFSERLFGTDLVRAFREIKEAFDPNNLLNPGKVVDPPRMDDESLMRFGTDYHLSQAPAHTAFHYTSDGGFESAVEMCNGAGVCRKTREGVMCPSFQVTREEADSTRGRANALRAAMLGLLGPNSMTSKELYEVMDLCISCHACKTECPSSVDMARLKSEFLYQYQQEHGTPMRSQLFGHIGRLSRLASRVPALSNLILIGPGRLALQILGVHPARSLPNFAPHTFSSEFNRQAHHPFNNENPAKREGPQVVFFQDTFLEHNHPRIGHAAVRVLRALGVEPLVLEGLGCCGRPAVSKGMLDEAKRLAAHNLALLTPYVHKGYSIVGCEPSCMAMFVDEIPDLLPGEQANCVSKAVMTIEQFIIQHAHQAETSLSFRPISQRILYHAHCQQKSTFGVENTLAMLSLIPEAEVSLIESGCCGMAGSFGYENEHYELSIQLAEMSLAPAVRAASMDTIICASGTSCRDQISHTTERAALHPIEVLAMALKPDGSVVID
jgi:FAD/FMN-containing dehydrogenase/Fe-S oxidoreductase